MGTGYQLLLTAPYALGFTYIIAAVFRRLSDKGPLPWNRVLRIFFTIGILFGFFFALYDYGAQALPPDQVVQPHSSVERFLQDILQKLR